MYRTRPANGHKRKSGMIVLAVYFDEDTFAEMRARAVKEKTSVGQQVRMLVEWGLEAEKK